MTTANVTQSAAGLVEAIRQTAATLNDAGRADLDAAVFALEASAGDLQARLGAAADRTRTVLSGLADYAASLSALLTNAIDAMTPPIADEVAAVVGEMVGGDVLEPHVAATVVPEPAADLTDLLDVVTSSAACPPTDGPVETHVMHCVACEAVHHVTAGNQRPVCTPCKDAGRGTIDLIHGRPTAPISPAAPEAPTAPVDLPPEATSWPTAGKVIKRGGSKPKFRR